MDEQNQKTNHKHSVTVLFRVTQGNGWQGIQNVAIFDEPDTANKRAQELLAPVKRLMPGEIVMRKGNLAEQTGVSVQEFMGMLGVIQVGFGVWEGEIQGDILVPHKRIVMPS